MKQLWRPPWLKSHPRLAGTTTALHTLRGLRGISDRVVPTLYKVAQVDILGAAVVVVAVPVDQLGVLEERTWYIQRAHTLRTP